jgi:undecaprenyl pyrophosphate phosphatase UppP
VSGSARRFATALIFAVFLGAPVLEMFDRWDQTAQTSNDTEAIVIVVALCVGVALVAVRRFLKPALRSARHERVSVFRPHRAVRRFDILPTPDLSPPTPLRV